MGSNDLKRFNKSNLGVWIILLSVLGWGIAKSVSDYKLWKHAEMDKYGQGWKDLSKPAMKLTTLYTDKLTGFRFRVPDGWKVEEGLGLPANPNLVWDQVVKPGQSLELVKVDNVMTINVENKQVNLTDEVGAEVLRLTKEGFSVNKDLSYVNSEKINLTVITYSEELAGGKANTGQEVLGVEGKKLFLMNVVVPEENWGDVKNTFEEIYKSVEVVQ